jgi:quaternary ammonium compound-resistance protein SugE
MAWVWLLAASAGEVGWMVLLKESDGFSRLGPTLGFAAAVALSMVGLAFAVRKIPIGTAYAVWTGLGAAAIAAIGIVAYGEPRTALRLGCIALILAGIAGLKLTSET